MNVLKSEIGEELSRMYIRGTTCIDHIYVTPTRVYDTINKCGIAPFDYFEKSDHRGICIDFELEKLIETEQSVMPKSHLRRLKTTSVKVLQKYQEKIAEETEKHELKKDSKYLNKS